MCSYVVPVTFLLYLAHCFDSNSIHERFHARSKLCVSLHVSLFALFEHKHGYSHKLSNATNEVHTEHMILCENENIHALYRAYKSENPIKSKRNYYSWKTLLFI